MSCDWMAVEVNTKLFKPREPLYDDQPDGYMISNKEWLDDNSDMLIRILEQVSVKLGYGPGGKYEH